MNFKKLILGAAIALSACSAALASADAFATAFIHVKFSGQSSFQCVDSNLTCATTGVAACRVFIQSLNRTTPAYSDAACLNAITSNSATISTAYQGNVADAD